MEALLEGRGFVTNGPILEFTANRAMPGDEIRLPEGGGEVVLRGVVNSIVPLDRLQLVHNGEVIEEISIEGEGMHMEFEREVPVTGSGWFTLQVAGQGRVHPIESRRPMATTNPIYVYVADRPIRNAASADYFVRWIDRLTQMATEHPGWRSDRERDHVLDQFRQARAVYLERGRAAR